MAYTPFERALQGLETGPATSDATSAGRGGEPGAASLHPSVDALRGKFGDHGLSHVVYSGDEQCVYVPAEQGKSILRWLREDAEQDYDFLQDLTAIDYGGGRPIELVYQLWSNRHKRQLRIKTALPLHALEADTVSDIWRTADWLEREVFDLFGVHFRGHPDLRRILMPENYAEGHPLRKDFPLRGRFSRAEQTRRALSMDVEDFYTPTELAVGGEPAGVAEGEAEDASANVTAAATDPMRDGSIPTYQRAPTAGGSTAPGGGA